MEPAFGHKGALRDPRHGSKWIFKLPRRVFGDAPPVYLVLVWLSARDLSTKDKLTTQPAIYNLSLTRERRRAGVGVVMIDLGSRSSGKPIVNFLRWTKGELSRSTKVCTLVLALATLTGQGGTGTIEDLLCWEAIVLILSETDNRLDNLEVIDEIRSISDIEPRDEVGVIVAEFRIVSDTELDPDESREENPEVSELLETLVIEPWVPGEAEKKDDRDELDILLKRVVYCVAVGWV